MSKLAIGFIGIGNMGSGMIQNLSKHHQVLGFDLNKSWINQIGSNPNIKPMETINDIAKNADTIITMLPNDKIVTKVAEEIFKYNNKTLIDSSTISPFAAKDLFALAQQSKNFYSDAPVSGGVGGAKNASLTFMVGADDVLYNKIKPVLEKMGKNIFNCGQVGGGQIAKICNNMALAIQMISVAEALALGSHLGMDAKLLSNIMSVSSSRCWSVDTYNPAPGVLPNTPVQNDYNTGFACELMLKDLRIAIDAAKRSNTHVAHGQLALSIYEKLNETLARKDIGVIYKQLLERL